MPALASRDDVIHVAAVRSRLSGFQNPAISGLIGAVAVVALWVSIGGVLNHSAGQAAWGFDFHGGIWPAASAILHGTSPFPPADPHVLFGLKTAFVTPPALALPAIPLAALPFAAAIAIWNLMSLCAVVAALWILGVREWRMYALALCSFPMINTLITGQPNAFFVLLLALTWRFRDDVRGPVAAGALIALKLVAWPLILWLLFTRRWRSAGCAAATAFVVLGASWALIDFKGLLEYPRLLAADAHAFEHWSQSLGLVGIALHLGLSPEIASVVAVTAGLAVCTLVVIIARGSDAGWFSSAVVCGLLVSPLLWPHYLLVMFVPLAITRPRALAPWLVSVAMWEMLSPANYVVNVCFVLGSFLAITLWGPAPARRTSSEPTEPSKLEAHGHAQASAVSTAQI